MIMRHNTRVHCRQVIYTTTHSYEMTDRELRSLSILFSGSDPDVLT